MIIICQSVKHLHGIVVDKYEKKRVFTQILGQKAHMEHIRVIFPFVGV